MKSSKKKPKNKGQSTQPKPQNSAALPKIHLEVGARDRSKQQRVVLVRFGDSGEHREHINTDSAVSRKQFWKRLAEKTGHDLQTLLAENDQHLVKMADEKDAATASAAAESKDDEGEKRERESQATILVGLSQDAGVELFHDPDGNAFARFPVDDHWEVAKIGSGAFKKWMSRLYYVRVGKAPNSQAKADAAGVLEGIAVYEGEERTVHIRVAGHGEVIYLDLCNSAWQVVEIGGAGWRVIMDPPVMFRRAKAMLALPTPIPGGSIDLLRPFFNVPESLFKLVVSWLVASFFPRGPYPVIQLDGEQGSGKSTKAKMLRSLVDPNTADLRSEPKEPRDLMIAANNGWVVAFDNLSHLHQWLSDALCRLSTGGGFSARTLYENDEETIFCATRPIILNGIEEVATNGDLVDRLIPLPLPAIPEEARQTEKELWAEFELAKPAILGALLDAVSGALRELPQTKLAKMPRMADFALRITAAESALGWAPGSFCEAYFDSREEANAAVLDTSLIAKYIMELSLFDPPWVGTATDLLEELEKRAGLAEARQKPKGWPTGPRAISGMVKRLAPNLRKAGVEVVGWRETGSSRRRMLSIRKAEQSSVPTVPTVRTDADANGSDHLGEKRAGFEDSSEETASQQDGSDGRDGEFPPISNSSNHPDEEEEEWTA